MKNIGKLSISLAIAVALTGCASTSNDSKAAKFPELKVMSEKTYVWDDSISEALNVARMAQPAGVGTGMKDFEDGTKANTGKIGAGEQAMDSALGLVSMGAFGVLSMGVLNSDVNEMLDWKPSFVFQVPVEEIQAGGKFDLKKTQLYVGSKIESTLKSSVPDLEWYGSFTNKLDSSNTAYAFNTSKCEQSIAPHFVDRAKAAKRMSNFGGLFFEDASFKEYCGLFVDLKIAGFIQKDGQKNAIVVGEVSTGHFFLQNLVQLDEYVIFPESFKLVTWDSRAGKYLRYKHALVTKSGHELKFQMR